MTDLTFTLLRLGYLVLLWVFVLSAIGVLRRDLYGTKITPRRGKKGGPAPAARPTSALPRPRRSPRGPPRPRDRRGSSSPPAR